MIYDGCTGYVNVFCPYSINTASFYYVYSCVNCHVHASSSCVWVRHDLPMMSNKVYQQNQSMRVSVLFYSSTMMMADSRSRLCGQGVRFLTINAFDQNVMLMHAVMVDGAHVENEK